VIAKTERRLRGAGLHAEADALDAQLLSVQHCDAVARKQLRYESNVRRRKRRRGP